MGEAAHAHKRPVPIEMKLLAIALILAIALPVAVHHHDEVRLKQERLELAAANDEAAALAREIGSLQPASRELANRDSTGEAIELAQLRNEISQTRDKLKE